MPQSGTGKKLGKLKGPHGVIPGYDGLAVADSKKQIIVAAQANGSVAEGPYFAEAPEDTAWNLRKVTGKQKTLEGATVLGDTAYFSEDNLQAAKARGIRAIIPDGQFRRRNEAMKDGQRRKGKERMDARYFKYHKRGN